VGTITSFDTTTKVRINYVRIRVVGHRYRWAYSRG